jgi:hypothetical protein
MTGAGEKLYPPDLLRQWKIRNEGSNGPALAALGPIDEDSLTDLLLAVFAPPVTRLQQIADQLEQTGTLSAQTVTQLRQVIDVMTSIPAGPDPRTAALLAQAADIYATLDLQTVAASLSYAADILPGCNQELDTKIAEMRGLADLISTSGGQGQYRPEW